MAVRGRKYFHKLNFVTREVFYLAHLNFSLTNYICSLWIFHYLVLLCIVLHHIAFNVVIHCSKFSLYYAVWWMYSFPPTKTPVVLINCSLFELHFYFFSRVILFTPSSYYLSVRFIAMYSLFFATHFHLSCGIFTSATFQLQLCFLSSN